MPKRKRDAPVTREQVRAMFEAVLDLPPGYFAGASEVERCRRIAEEQRRGQRLAKVTAIQREVDRLVASRAVGDGS